LGTNSIILFDQKHFGKFWDKVVFFYCKFDQKIWKFLDITKVKKNQLTKSAIFLLKKFLLGVTFL